MSRPSGAGRSPDGIPALFDIVGALAAFREFETTTAGEPAGVAATALAAEAATQIRHHFTTPADAAVAGTAIIAAACVLSLGVARNVPAGYLPIIIGLAGANLLEGAQEPGQ